MSFVFVLDTNKQLCNSVHPGEARRLLLGGQAAVFRRFPFTIILKAATEQEPTPLRLKLDPGSKTTGIALVDDETGKVVWAAELTHRGQQIRDALESRRATRRSRRSRHTRYRAPRFLNRTRPKGWLAPSLESGTSRVSNLTLACHECNQRKGSKTAAGFGFPELQTKAKQPLKDAAAVNSTRWALFERLQASGLPVELGSGGRTQFNRTGRGLDKTHWLDAACVGQSTPLMLHTHGIRPLSIKATGHGSRQMCRMDKYGFPRTSPKGARVVHGFKTGDMVNAVVTTGTKIGSYVGRVAVRSTGSFNITTATATIQGLHYRFFRAIHRSDGYGYAP